MDRTTKYLFDGGGALAGRLTDQHPDHPGAVVFITPQGVARRPEDLPPGQIVFTSPVDEGLTPTLQTDVLQAERAGFRVFTERVVIVVPG